MFIPCADRSVDRFRYISRKSFAVSAAQCGLKLSTITTALRVYGSRCLDDWRWRGDKSICRITYRSGNPILVWKAIYENEPHKCPEVVDDRQVGQHAHQCIFFAPNQFSVDFGHFGTACRFMSQIFQRKTTKITWSIRTFLDCC